MLSELAPVYRTKCRFLGHVAPGNGIGTAVATLRSLALVPFTSFWRTTCSSEASESTAESRTNADTERRGRRTFN